jgi:hypothetical protein
MGILARANEVMSAMCLIFLIYVTEGKLFSRVRKRV